MNNFVAGYVACLIVVFAISFPIFRVYQAIDTGQTVAAQIKECQKQSAPLQCEAIVVPVKVTKEYVK